MTTTTLRREIEIISPTRQRVMGIVFLILGLGIWFLFSRGVDPEIVTVFGMTPGGFDATIPDMTLPTLLTLNILAGLSIILGLIQLIRPSGFGKRTNLILGLVAGMFIFAFLTWGAGGKSLNLAGLLNTTSVSYTHLRAHET